MSEPYNHRYARSLQTAISRFATDNKLSVPFVIKMLHDKMIEAVDLNERLGQIDDEARPEVRIKVISDLTLEEMWAAYRSLDRLDSLKGKL